MVLLPPKCLSEYQPKLDQDALVEQYEMLFSRL